MQLLGDDTVLEVNSDVTEYKQIEAALRETENVLRWLASIVESSDDAIVSKNLQRSSAAYLNRSDAGLIDIVDAR